MTRRFLSVGAVAFVVVVGLWGAWEFFSYHNERLRTRGWEVATEVMAEKIVEYHVNEVREALLGTGATPEEVDESMAELRAELTRFLSEVPVDDFGHVRRTLANARQRALEMGADPERIELALQEFLARVDQIERDHRARTREN